jgi:hypothetical protein
MEIVTLNLFDPFFKIICMSANKWLLQLVIFHELYKQNTLKGNDNNLTIEIIIIIIIIIYSSFAPHGA